MTDPRLRFLVGTVDDADLEEVLRLLDDTTVRIVAEGPLYHWRHQVLLFVLVDLLGRVLPRLAIEVEPGTPAAAGLPRGPGTVGHRLAATRARSPLPARPPTHEMAITIQIGPGGTEGVLRVDASEWQSYLGFEPSRLHLPRRDSAVGPAAAACRGAAAVYAMVLEPVRDRLDLAQGSYRSALTHREGSDPIDDPYPQPIGALDLLLAGAGSVGGATALVMHYEQGLSGHIDVCDPQMLDHTNPFRALLATAPAAKAQESKVGQVKAALAHHSGLAVDAHVTTVEEWDAGRPQPAPLPLTLVAVDSRNARESIQDALPLDVVNAAVGGDLLSVSGHRTGNGPCMCCLHMPQVLDTTQTKNRLISDATGIRQPEVNEMRVRSVPLSELWVRQIESNRRLEPRSLSQFVGRTLDDLWNDGILYGETEVRSSAGKRIAVAAPFTTALAGVLLAAEAFKRSTPKLSAYALGTSGAAVRYWEEPYAPQNGILDVHVPRSDICICRSVRRLRLTAELYGVSLEAMIG